MLLEEIPSVEKVHVLGGEKIQAENIIEQQEIEMVAVQEVELV